MPNKRSGHQPKGGQWERIRHEHIGGDDQASADQEEQEQHGCHRQVAHIAGIQDLLAAQVKCHKNDQQQREHRRADQIARVALRAHQAELLQRFNVICAQHLALQHDGLPRDKGTDDRFNSPAGLLQGSLGQAFAELAVGGDIRRHQIGNNGSLLFRQRKGHQRRHPVARFRQSLRADGAAHHAFQDGDRFLLDLLPARIRQTQDRQNGILAQVNIIQRCQVGYFLVGGGV